MIVDSHKKPSNPHKSLLHDEHNNSFNLHKYLILLCKKCILITNHQIKKRSDWREGWRAFLNEAAAIQRLIIKWNQGHPNKPLIKLTQSDYTKERKRVFKLQTTNHGLHMYSTAGVLPQLLSRRLKLIGRSRLMMPKTLALIAVQRQRATSRSTNPWIRLQQGWVGTLPSLTSTKPSRLAHTPRFRGLHRPWGLFPLGNVSPGCRITTGFLEFVVE